MCIRDRHDPALQVPAQDGLRRSDPVRGGDLRHHRVGEQLAATHRAPGLGDDALRLVEGVQPGLREVGMQLDLVHRRGDPGLVLQALDQASDDTGWANLALFGSYLTKLQSDFDPRLYGFKKLSDLVKSKPQVFGVEEREVAGTNSKVIYVRSKAAKNVKTPQ